MKHQNRENASMTRRRRRVYNELLTCLLNDLNILLAPEIECGMDQMDEIIPLRELDLPPVCVAVPQYFLGNLGQIPQSVLLSTALKYFKARVDVDPKAKLWDSMCVNDVYQSISPCPPYVFLNGRGGINDIHESQGIRDIIECAGLRLQLAIKVINIFYPLVISSFHSVNDAVFAQRRRIFRTRG